MQRYKLGETLGAGNFGSVIKGIDVKTGRMVAIKAMKRKYSTWDECISLNEIKVLAKLHHPNIINLHQIIKEKNVLYFVFEYMPLNVLEVMQKNTLEVRDIRNIVLQTLQGLAYMHRHGYFHRDLKPQNLLYCNGSVKIADFGLAREIRAMPPFTQYVSTRWYRAPEVVLRYKSYNAPMDIFAMGAIMAQLYNGYPLFPGTSQKDQLHRILRVIGAPSREDWPEGYKIAAQLGLELPKYEPQNLSALIPKAPLSAIELIQQMLIINPNKRITALNAVKHPYFNVKSEGYCEKIRHKENISEEELDWTKRIIYRPNYSN